MKNSEILIEEIKKEFLDFKLVYKKNSKLMKFIDLFLRVLTFGKNKTFMTEFVTTIKNTVYLNSEWDNYTDSSKCTLLRHERIHMRQAQRYGFILYTFLYLFVYFPVGFAYYRAKFEKEAYEESIRASYEYYGNLIINSKNYREYIIRQFVGPSYGWMFPFRVKMESWYDSIIQDIINNVKK